MNNSNKPFISIILPIYNADKYLSATLDSIFSQTHSNFELIALNDCSADNSLSILNVYKKDSRLRIINHEKNLKLIETLNEGIRLSKYELIARCDADDIYHPRRFELQLNYLLSNPQIGVVGSDALIINSENEIIGTTYNFPITDEAIKYRLRYKSAFFHSSVMFRKSLLTSSQCIYNENYPHAEDYALWLQLSQSTQFYNIRQKLIFYRKHKDSVSYQHSQIQKDSSLRAQKDFLIDQMTKKSSYGYSKEYIWENRYHLNLLLKYFFVSPFYSILSYTDIIFNILTSMIDLQFQKRLKRPRL